MLEKKELSSSTELEIAIPESGFSTELIEALYSICTKQKNLLEGYLVLKKVDEDVSLLLGLLFSDTNSINQQEQAIQMIVLEVADLFSDDLTVDAICLNQHNQLKQSIMSATSPFYKRD
jgi:hypothetical protein